MNIDTFNRRCIDDASTVFIVDARTELKSYRDLTSVMYRYPKRYVYWFSCDNIPLQTLIGCPIHVHTIVLKKLSIKNLIGCPKKIKTLYLANNQKIRTFKCHVEYVNTVELENLPFVRFTNIWKYFKICNTISVRYVTLNLNDCINILRVNGLQRFYDNNLIGDIMSKYVPVTSMSSILQFQQEYNKYFKPK